MRKGIDAVALALVRSALQLTMLLPGCVLELGKHFRVSGAEIVNYKSDLPIKNFGWHTRHPTL